MAIVPDLSENYPENINGAEGSFSTVNRVVAAAPNGVTTPLYSGEIVRDTSSQALWQAIGLTNTAWVPTSIEG